VTNIVDPIDASVGTVNVAVTGNNWIDRVANIV
jgi:hypothetical protein